MSASEPSGPSGPIRATERSHGTHGKPAVGRQGFNLVRAGKIALVLLGLLLAAILTVALMTDGTPHVPFDYGEF